MPRSTTLLRVAAVLTAIGLGFMLWSIFVPTALPVVLAMSLGQGIGILAFALYGYVVFADLRTQRAATRAALRRAAVTIRRAEADEQADESAKQPGATPPAASADKPKERS